MDEGVHQASLVSYRSVDNCHDWAKYPMAFYFSLRKKLRNYEKIIECHSENRMMSVSAVAQCPFGHRFLSYLTTDYDISDIDYETTGHFSVASFRENHSHSDVVVYLHVEQIITYRPRLRL